MARKGGRKFGEASYSCSGLMTRYTRSSGGSKGSMKIKGRKESSNGMKNLKGRRTTIKVGLGAKGF
jgi:hypothetical protein